MMVLLRVKEIKYILPYTGIRKLQKMLQDSQYGLPIKIGRDHLLRLLRDNKLLSPLRKRYQHTTNSRHTLPRYPNLLQNRDVSQVNEVWVSDITYINLNKGKFCYLFLVTDYFSRKIMGYALKQSLSVEGALEALEMSIKYGKPPAGFIHHSDRGLQYCSKEYVNKLQSHAAQISMTGDNHCYDNALAERVNGILKQEFGLGANLRDIEAAKTLTDEGIRLYNSVRLHLSLGYRTPDHIYTLLNTSFKKSLKDTA